MKCGNLIIIVVGKKDYNSNIIAICVGIITIWHNVQIIDYCYVQYTQIQLSLRDINTTPARMVEW